MSIKELAKIEISHHIYNIEVWEDEGFVLIEQGPHRIYFNRSYAPQVIDAINRAMMVIRDE